MKILVIGESPEQRTIIQCGLTLAGFSSLFASAVPLRITDLVEQTSPGAVIVALTNPDAQILGQIFEFSKTARLPVILFVEQCDKDTVSTAVEAGIAAIIVDGLKKERAGIILELAIARFRCVEKLKAELSTARSALKNRKVIDRAKGALMKANGLDEDAAYALLRETAMRQSRKISDVAENLLNTLDLLQPAARDR